MHNNTNQTSTRFFQTPLETCYGSLIHKHKASIFNPKVHYCTCGGNAKVVLDVNQYSIQCQLCSNTSESFEHSIEAVYAWNTSELSQFPSRIALLPFNPNKSMSFNPHELNAYAKQIVESFNSPKNSNTNTVRLLAAKYVQAWSNWFIVNYDLLDQQEYAKSFDIFMGKFYAITFPKLNSEQSRIFNNYCHVHSGKTKEQNILNFTRIHLKEMYNKTLEHLPYPNRLQTKVQLAS